MQAHTFEPRYDLDVLRAQQRFIRLVGDPVLRSIGKPPNDFPLVEFKHALAHKMNADPRFQFQLKPVYNLFCLGQRLVEMAPLPIHKILREFPSHPFRPYNILHSEFEAFKYLEIELIRRCIASGAVLCFAVDLGYFSVVEPGFFHCPAPSEKLSLPPLERPWRAIDLVRHYQDDFGVDYFCFVLFENVKHLFETVVVDLPDVRHPDEGSHGLAPSIVQIGGYAALDQPYVEKAMKMLEGCQVSSPREAARIAAEELEKVGDTYPGKYPGASASAIHDRIYKRVLKALKLKDSHPIP